MPTPSLSRVAPPYIETVTIDNTGYYLDNIRDQDFTFATTYLIAIDSNNDEIWRAPIYTIEYDQKLETDVQDVYPVSLDFNVDTHCFVIKNEDDDVFTLNLNTLEVSAV
jgi:hypothetical protein